MQAKKNSLHTSHKTIYNLFLQQSLKNLELARRHYQDSKRKDTLRQLGGKGKVEGKEGKGKDIYLQTKRQDTYKNITINFTTNFSNKKQYKRTKKLLNKVIRNVNV